MMEQCQPANRDTPSNVRDTSLSAKRFGTRSAETIRASSRVRCANRPDTRLHLTGAHISSKNVLLCRSHPHKTLDQLQHARQTGRPFPVGKALCRHSQIRLAQWFQGAFDVMAFKVISIGTNTPVRPKAGQGVFGLGEHKVVCNGACNQGTIQIT